MYTNFDAHNVYNIDRINSNLQILITKEIQIWSKHL